MPCRKNRHRIWAHRIMLETNLHTDNCFVTLTYSDETLPKTSQSLPTLDPKDLQLWLKRFRKRIAPSTIRFYATGEYGDETQRPHYHVALFGYPNCSHGNSRYSNRRTSCCLHCDLIRDTWQNGNIYVGDLNISSAQYVAQYVTKKLTDKRDPRLMGRHPEFGRMSLKPGIGSDFMHEVASTLLGHSLEALPDAPASLQHGTRKLPLGRHLRSKLRTYIGKEPGAPQSTIDELQAQLQPLRETAFNNSESFKKTVVEAHDQKVLNAETKAKIFKQRKTL